MIKHVVKIFDGNAWNVASEHEGSTSLESAQSQRSIFEGCGTASGDLKIFSVEDGIETEVV